jgi:hypothetical protein
MTNNDVAQLKPQKEAQAQSKLLTIEFFNPARKPEVHVDVRWITSDDRFLRIVFTDGAEKWINSKLIEHLFLESHQEPEATVGCL